MSNSENEQKDNKNVNDSGKGYEIGYGKPPKDKQFTSENQPGNQGRKPSKLRHYIIDNDVSIHDVRLVLKNIVMENTWQELLVIFRDESQPMLVRSIIGAYLKDFENHKIDNLNTVLDRIYGKALQEVALSGEVVTLTPEERRARIKELEEKRKHERETSEES